MAGNANRILAGGNAIGLWSCDDGATPTVASTYNLYLWGNIISTDVSRQDTGAYNVSVEHVEDNKALQDFIEAATTVAGNVEDLMFEDSTSEMAGTNQKYIMAVKGGLAGGVANAARKCGVFPVRLANTSGGWTQSGETYNRVNLEFEGFKLAAPITLLATHLTGFMTTPTPVTLTASKAYGTVVFG